MGLKRKDLLSIHELTSDEVGTILDMTRTLKTMQKSGQEHFWLKGKTLGMIFEKASTRTRVSFEVGMRQLGGTALFLSAGDLQSGRGEPLKDTARVLSRYVDAIMIRTFAHSRVEELAHYAAVPVINGLTDLAHPCQALADLYTALEHKGALRGLRLAYIGDGNNMANTLLHACAKVGMDIAVATPPGYGPDPGVVAQARAAAGISGSAVSIGHDPLAAARDADILYTDVWASMGQESEQQLRREAFAGFRLDEAALDAARPGAIVMHCLPAHRGEEISEQVLEGPRSVVFDEAENRLHAQKAVLALLLGDN